MYNSRQSMSEWYVASHQGRSVEEPRTSQSEHSSNKTI
jgi:hypothetical protein